MNLKEFDLDLPYVPNETSINSIIRETNCHHSEATKLDYEINWKEKRRTFRLETRCVSAMFERLLGTMKTIDCWKVLVECVEEVKDERVLNLSGVYTIQLKFNYKDFLSINEYKKKQMTLSMLMEGIRTISRIKGWGLEPFEIVHSKICKANYINEWVWKKSVKSTDKKFSAEVLMQHEVKSMDISILVRDKSGAEISRKKIISELPDEFAYVKHLGELKWLSSNEVALINKKGDEKWLCQL